MKPLAWHRAWCAEHSEETRGCSSELQAVTEQVSVWASADAEPGDPPNVVLDAPRGSTWLANEEARSLARALAVAADIESAADEPPAATTISESTPAAAPAQPEAGIPPHNTWDCPRWCSDLWHDPDEPPSLVVEHGRGVAGGFLPETRRIEGRITRPDQGTWELDLYRRDHRTGADGARPAGRYPDLLPFATDYVDDAVVRLKLYIASEARQVSVNLLPGEALSIAAALARAADVLVFAD